MSSKGLSVDDEVASVGDGNSGFSMMQHLIDEMDKSSQRIDEFNTEEFGEAARGPHNDRHHFDLLYDEAWKSEDSDAASLKEVPADFFDKGQAGDSGCEDAVTSAIAEVSKDFLAGLRANAARCQSGDSDESHLSSDTEFRLIKGMPAYARYPETAAGLSDNDWNPYGTESDTNISPRLPASQETPGARVSSSKLSAMMSFNPPLHSTDLDAITPSSAIGSIPNTCARMQGIHEVSEQDSVVPLKPDVTADFSTISHMSEQTFGSHAAAAPASEPVRLSDLNKTMREAELEGFGKSEKGMGIAHLERELTNLRMSHKDSADKSMTTPSKPPDFKPLIGSYMSVMDRAKMVGVPGDIVDGNGKSLSKLQQSRETGELTKGDDDSDDDRLGQKVKKVLSDTKHLEKKKTMTDVVIDYHSLQKDLQEIQDSLNHNFVSGTASTIMANNNGSQSGGSKSTPPSSDNDGDIIPSTTTTPDRKRNSNNQMAWDFAGDLAAGGGRLSGHMEEVSLHTYAGGNTSSSHRASTEKQSYNSDGDDTRTSGSSDRVDDHVAADQALGEMSTILRPHPQLMMTAAGATGRGIHSVQDVDAMLSTFQDQRRELESRYQQLSNPGLADKVFRILTTQDPEAQADGILSQVSAQEREDRARYALSLHNTDRELNFSSTDTDNLNTTGQSFAGPPDDVRRRLDLSGLSSADGSRVGDKSSFALPSSKGFSAFDEMTKFLSSQMAKASEQTFNHSLEMRLPPQVVTCYPLLADRKDGEDDGEKDKAEGVLAGAAAIDGQSADILSGQPPEGQPTATSSPIEAFTEEQKDKSNDHHSSPEDSDSSSSKHREKYRPYRPPGSKDFYYTESDVASIADSVTTIESTHIGSDDARGPALPPSVLGSRKDPPSAGGIYAKHKPLSSLQEAGSLPPIQEKSISDDRESESNPSSRSNGELSSKGKDSSAGGRGGPSARLTLTSDRDDGIRVTRGDDDDGIRVTKGYSAPVSAEGSSSSYSRGVAAARREAQWENRVRERQQDYLASEPVSNVEETVAQFSELSDLGSVGTYYSSQRLRREEEEERREPIRQPYKASSDRPGLADRVSGRGFDEKDEEPLSLRVKMTYRDDATGETERKERVYPTEHRERVRDVEREEKYIVEENRDRFSRPQGYRSGLEGRYPSQQNLSSLGARSSYVDRENAYSSRIPDHPPPPYQEEEDLSSTSPVRDARLSPAFHRALSAELRQAIEARSPLLSQNIERSLAQAPVEVPATSTRRWRDDDNDDKDKDLPRGRRSASSPPPTFLARERGQPPRDYAPRSPVAARQRSPPPVARKEQAWTTTEQQSRSPIRHRSPSPPAYQTRPRSPPPPTQQTRSRSPMSVSQQTHQERRLSPVSLPQDLRTRSLSPTQRNPTTSAPEPMSWAATVEQRKRHTEPSSKSPNLSQRTPTKSHPSHQRRSPSPHRHVERTLENMTSESEDTEIDREPLSRRAQMLTAALPQERDIRPDINTLWDRFKAQNESNNESSMDSSRLEAVTDLLRNPSRHLIAHYLQEREEYRIERQERAEAERERRLKEQLQLQGGVGSHHHHHLHSSSEDDFNGEYSNMLAKKEEERQKRRAVKKKKGKPAEVRKGMNDDGEKGNKENVPDSLFSIPEDGAPEQQSSPAKAAAVSRSQKNKTQSKQDQQHIIDPYMQKLRERISKQRGKIDKQTLREFQRVEKLKKLEHLLTAKNRGQISNETLEARLGELSAASTPGSNSSQENEDANNIEDGNDNTTPLSEDSTTAKDSSAEMHAWKAEKERRVKEMKMAAEMERRKEEKKNGEIQRRKEEVERKKNMKMVEMERRKDFKSRPMKEMDRNTNRKVSNDNPSSSLSSTKARVVSDIKLLELASQGYLTPEEAYRLALERAQQQQYHHHHRDVDADSSVASHSSSEDHSFSGRPHRLYSPYARQNEFHEVKAKHVPKLKQLSPTTFADQGSTFPRGSQVKYQRGWGRRGQHQTDVAASRTLPEPSRSRSASPGYRATQVGKDQTRPASRSPSSRQERRGLSFKSSSPTRVGGRRYATSPQGKVLLPHHHHHQRGERFPTRQEPHRRAGRERPTSPQAPPMKGVSWHIPIDTHPSKWEEPQTGKSHNDTNENSSRRRPQLPLSDPPPPLPSPPPPPTRPAATSSPPLGEGEEPLQRWEKQASRGADSVGGFWHKSDHPHGIPQELWEEVVSQDALASKANHWEVDPLMDRVQYILNKESPTAADENIASGMTLQEAFLARKQIFISKCRERQKRIVLGRENRHLQECLRLEREAIFAESDRPLAPNLHAHPCSENLFHPKRRVIPKSEMKALTQKRYKKLHEVVQKQEQQKNEAESKLNRLRVRIFNRKVQRGILRQKPMRRR